MRNLGELDRFRRTDLERHLAGATGDDYGGVFVVPIKGRKFSIIVGVGLGWDHVSVSLPNRCPTWEEMETIKRLFFLPDETAMQLHVPASDHINLFPYCLHLWRPHYLEIPRPPAGMV